MFGSMFGGVVGCNFPTHHPESAGEKMNIKCDGYVFILWQMQQFYSGL